MNDIENQISLYNDIMLIEAFLQDKDNTVIVKNAAFSFNTFFNDVKSYFSNKIDPNDKLGSIVNFMAPGLIFRTLGVGKLGFLLSTVTSLMGIDFAGMLSSAWNALIPKLKSGNVTDSDVDSAVQSVVESQDSNLTDSQKQEVLKEQDSILKLFSFSSLNIDEVDVLSKLAITAQKSIMRGDSISDVKYNIDKIARGRRGVKLNLILFAGKIIKFILLAALAAVGFNVGADLVKKMTGIGNNAFDGPAHPNAPQQNKPQTSSIVVPKQTVFPVKSNYTENVYNGNHSNWIEKYPNTTSGIKSMLIDFTKDVYDNTNNIESIILSSSAFNNVLYDIEDYNISAAGDSFVFIPKKFKSKKKLVDHFIDDVARLFKSKTPNNKTDNADPLSKYKPKEVIVT